MRIKSFVCEVFYFWRITSSEVGDLNTRRKLCRWQIISQKYQLAISHGILIKLDCHVIRCNATLFSRKKTKIDLQLLVNSLLLLMDLNVLFSALEKNELSSWNYFSIFVDMKLCRTGNSVNTLFLKHGATSWEVQSIQLSTPQSFTANYLLIIDHKWHFKKRLWNNGWLYVNPWGSWK